MQTHLPLQTFLQPYLVNAHHFKLGSNNLSSITAIPKGNIFLFFIWGNGKWVYRKPNRHEIAKDGGLYVLGQQFEVTILSTKKKELNIIGFEINPIAFYQLFKISAKSLVNQLICLHEIPTIESSEVFWKVSKEECIVKKLRILENFLEALVQSRNENKYEILSQALFIIEQKNGNICIEKLAEILDICSRNLQRKFLKNLGIPPKTYSKIIQFNYAFRQFVQTNKKIVDIALEAGYYDQSHFVNHFKKVCGMCPTNFLSNNKLLGYDGNLSILKNTTGILSSSLQFKDKIFLH